MHHCVGLLNGPCNENMNLIIVRSHHSTTHGKDQLERSVVDVIKFFLEEIWISSKLPKKLKMFALMSELAQKCQSNAIVQAKLYYTTIFCF